MRIPLPISVSSVRPRSRIFGWILACLGNFVDTNDTIEGLKDRCFAFNSLLVRWRALGIVGAFGGFGWFGGRRGAGGFAGLPLQLALT